MRLPFLLATAFLATFLLAGMASAETASSIAADPHFSLLFHNGKVEVYSLVLRPQERSYDLYDHNFLLVTLQDSELVMWPEGASDIPSFHLVAGGTNFFYSGRAQGLRNTTSSTYRGVLVEFLDPGVTPYSYQWRTGQWDFGYTSVGSPGNPKGRFSSELPLGEANLIGAQLLPGDPLPRVDATGPALLVPVTDIDLKAGDGETIRRSSGEVLWLGVGPKSPYLNAGSQPTRLVLIEFRPDNGASSPSK